MSIFKPKIITYTDNNLIFELYLVGLKGLEESIIFFVKSNNCCLYSGMVDCYFTKQKSIIKELLEENNIKELNFLCWTHPHDDHSMGISDILDNFCSKNTSIWIPDVNSINNNEYSNKSFDFYKKLFEKFDVKKQDYLWNINKVSDDKNLISIQFNNLNIIHSFTIESFSPPSKIILYDQATNKVRNINNYSIGLIINIGVYYILLGSDVQNEVLQILPDFDLEGIEYIKIPHHGSDTSNLIINKFDQNIHPTIAATTVFRAKNLPNKNVLEQYKEWGVQSLFCTGHLNTSDTEDYGFIKTTFDVLKSSGNIIIKNECYGNAEEL